jgi:invasion protein IalB
MRRWTGLIIGALAAVTAAGLYGFIYSTLSSGIFAAMAGGQRIEPGFIGVADFGRWRLICIPGPPTLDGVNPTETSASAGQPKQSGNSCRINQEIAEPDEENAAAQTEQNPRRVIIAANFSLLGRQPAIMLRLPATARDGDVITLHFDNRASVTTIVRDCKPEECVAAGSLTSADWSRLSATKTLQVSFPVLHRQWVLLNVPVDGLSTAIAALSRAVVSSAS